MDSGTSAERQLYILSLLAQSERGYTLKEIMERLEHVGIECTRRMAARDMDSISRNFYVYEDSVDGKTVYKADKYAAAKMDFSMPQIISLYYIKEVLRQNSRLKISREAEEIIDSILGQMPALSRAALTDVQNMIKVAPAKSSGEAELSEAILDSVREAAAQKKRLRMTYISFYADEETERLFDPYVLEVREGCWHAIGYCHMRGSVRDFRISRIKSAEVLAHSFDIPEDFYEEYRRTRFDKLAGEDASDIEIVFTGHAARLVAEFNSEMADELTDEPDGLHFKKRAAITPDLVQWALSYGAGARAIAPAELAEEIKRQAEGILNLYGGSK